MQFPIHVRVVKKAAGGPGSPKLAFSQPLGKNRQYGWAPMNARKKVYCDDFDMLFCVKQLIHNTNKYKKYVSISYPEKLRHAFAHKQRSDHVIAPYVTVAIITIDEGRTKDSIFILFLTRFFI